MDQAELSALVADLFVTIKLLSGYPVPEKMPAVHLVSLAEIQQKVCQGPCQVKAFYLPEEGVFINSEINITQDAYSRSILLHELVHHVQEMSGRFESLPTACGRWYSKEFEAYRIQNAYLKDQKEPRRFMVDTLPHMCGSDEETPSASK